ncbi:MAG: FmdB family zinc ribbon protein [Longimicrobiales bacterium]
MPTYEYRCQKCGETFEQVQHISEHDTAQPLCPKCESAEVEPLMSSFVAQTSKKS